MGKHKYPKGLGFLHVPHSSISCEIETIDDDCRVLTYYVIFITYLISFLRQHISI